MKLTNPFAFRCFYCQQSLALPWQGLCCRCQRQIIQIPYCGKCGSPLPEYHLGCGYCSCQQLLWDRMIYVSPYQAPLSELIHRFKFQQQYYLDRTLARLLLLAVLNAKREQGLSLPELLLPVPLHHHRQWQRGYNQAGLLADYLGYYLTLPVNHHWLKRQRATPSQRGLVARERQKNLVGAFSLKAEVRVQSVAIIDDVITTGATMYELCVLLRQQGVSEIQVWALCRT
ncbi:amidophosphoribosyltransferase [Mergibacter septicus]|uniref:phosphoribosyltransferase family protein n=1 Tax=Mergibacter septicus TaxID=221402 RepID=UPI001179249F|nr:phosphoribosyltransferase family protein [Mergibacter septicus]AWX14190.1 amidophosphoribosyltransferase [Mergibacter septicus]